MCAIGAVPAGVDPDPEVALDESRYAIACIVPKAQFASLDVDRDGIPQRTALRPQPENIDVDSAVERWPSGLARPSPRIKPCSNNSHGVIDTSNSRLSIQSREFSCNARMAKVTGEGIKRMHVLELQRCGVPISNERHQPGDAMSRRILDSQDRQPRLKQLLGCLLCMKSNDWRSEHRLV